MEEFEIKQFRMSIKKAPALVLEEKVFKNAIESQWKPTPWERIRLFFSRRRVCFDGGVILYYKKLGDKISVVEEVNLGKQAQEIIDKMTMDLFLKNTFTHDSKHTGNKKS